MATLETWNGRTAGQTDGDSPLDETLTDGIRLDLDHLRQVVYGDNEGSGTYHTPTWGHTHNGSDSNYITEIGAGAVSQSSLDSTTGVVSTNQPWVDLTLPGGEYGFYPQIKMNSTQTRYWEAAIHSHIQANAAYSNVGVKAGWTSYVTNITLGVQHTDGTIYAQQRYIQASPPYNLGNGDIPLFIYASVNNSTGKIESTYIAEDPPWANNGPRRINPHKTFTKKNGKKYLKRTKRPWSHAEVKADKVKFRENMDAIKNPIIEEVEITQAIKNAGMPDIPHPFMSHNPVTHTVVLLDPCSQLCDDLHMLAKEGDEGVTEVSEIINVGHIKIDNNPISGLITPPGVKGVKMRLD